MNKNIQKVFDDIHGEFTSYQSAVAAALSAYRRDLEAAKRTAAQYKDEAGELSRRKDGLIATARSKISEADKGLHDAVTMIYLPKLREALSDYVCKRADRSFMDTLRDVWDFNLSLSRAELDGYILGADGNYTALRALQAVAKRSGYRLAVPSADDYQGDIDRIERAVRVPLMYAPYDYQHEALEVLPDRPEDKDERMHLEYLTPIQTGSKESGLGVSAIQVDQLQHELRRMMLMAQENVEASFRSVLDRNEDELSQVEETEEYIDFLNREISLHISHVIAYETNQQASAVVSSFLTISGNIERIGDHADNLAGYTRMLNRRDIAFSQTAQQEIVSMQDICLKGIQQLLSDQAGSVEWLTQVSALEQRIDDMTRDYRRGHLARMQSGECSAEGGILYSELLTDFERIGDHILNIAQELSKVHQHI